MRERALPKQQEEQQVWQLISHLTSDDQRRTEQGQHWLSFFDAALHSRVQVTTNLAEDLLFLFLILLRLLILRNLFAATSNYRTFAARLVDTDDDDEKMARKALELTVNAARAHFNTKLYLALALTLSLSLPLTLSLSFILTLLRSPPHAGCVKVFGAIFSWRSSASTIRVHKQSARKAEQEQTKQCK